MRTKGFILDPSGELNEPMCVKAQLCVPDTVSHKQRALPAVLRGRKGTLESAGAARCHSGSYSGCLPLKLHIGVLLNAGAFARRPVQAPLRPCAGCLLPLPTDDLATGSTTLLPELLNCPLPPRNLALQDALESTGLPVSR